MKFPLFWHEECLKNQRSNLEGRERYLALVTEEVKRQRKALAFETARLEQAKAEGLTGYDPERYGLKRGEKRR